MGAMALLCLLFKYFLSIGIGFRIVLEKAEVTKHDQVGDGHLGLPLLGQQGVRRQDVKLHNFLDLLLSLLGLQVW